MSRIHRSSGSRSSSRFAPPGVVVLALALAAGPGFALVPLGSEVRVSVTGPPEDPAFDALTPVAAFDPAHSRTLVCWASNDAGDDEWEILCQIRSVDGLVVRATFDASEFGPTSPTIRADFDAIEPALAFDPDSGRYLLCWSGDTSEANHVDDESEIWCRVLDADGEPVGATREVSEQGAVGDPAVDAVAPTVAWSSPAGKFVVCWEGDGDLPGQIADDELEIWCRPFDAFGPEGEPERMSHAGADGDPATSARAPRVVARSSAVAGVAEAVVCWEADGDVPDHADDEFEIFCRRLDAADAAPLDAEVRISTQGGSGGPLTDATEVDLAFDEPGGALVACWRGSINTAQTEVYCSRRDAALAAAVAARRISFETGAGPLFNSASDPAIAASGSLVVACWAGYENAFEGNVSCVALDRELNPAGGGPLAVSDVDPTGQQPWIARARTPAIVAQGSYDAVVALWSADSVIGGMADDDHETFARRLRVRTILVDGFEVGDFTYWSSTTP